MSDNKTASKKRIESLTGLKVVAMLLIFWWHGYFPLPSVDLGARSCELLFVASGFLVGYNYYNKNVPATWKGSARYALSKIVMFYPLHLITFFVSLIVSGVILLNGKFVLKSILNLLLLQAWSPSTETSMAFNGLSWFLSALMFCYFMSPVFLRFLKRQSLSGIAFVLVFGARFLLEFSYSRYGASIIDISIHTSPLVRSMEFFMGMLLVPWFIKADSFLNNKLSEIKQKVSFSLIEAAALFLTVFAAVNYNDVLPKSVFVLIFCFLIFFFAFDGGILSKILSLKPFAWFSNIQFEFYLLHGLIIKYCSEIFSKIRYLCDWRIMNVVIFAIIIAVSVLYKKFLSKPLSSFLKKIINKLFSSLGMGIKV